MFLDQGQFTFTLARIMAGSTGMALWQFQPIMDFDSLYVNLD